MTASKTKSKTSIYQKRHAIRKRAEKHGLDVLGEYRKAGVLLPADKVPQDTTAEAPPANGTGRRRRRNKHAELLESLIPHEDGFEINHCPRCGFNLKAMADLLAMITGAKGR